MWRQILFKETFKELFKEDYIIREAPKKAFQALLETISSKRKESKNKEKSNA